ncbi:hypothetical protein [Halomonas sp. Mc5H-6]|uniref:hypothetical protein n=1 Tax=Halomonas sp. Mc5H-6 TaxID=2954500 RepID=UPI002097C37A|nr:hypothetical protein [Halomonas sp. Mc5H-6]MCO7246386.1 hypothetical protein [Halomonas sp. Mc5H-6]
MAKATRPCPCCSTETLTFVAGSRKEVERYADWKIDHGALCDTCTAKKREQDSLNAAEEAADKGLPTLRGTEKQVAWAETIRAELLAIAEKLTTAITLVQAGNVDAARAAYRDVPVTWQPSDFYFRNLNVSEDQVPEAALAVCRFLAEQQDAGWWIDFRGASFEALVKHFHTQVLDVLKGAPSAREIAEEVAVKPERPISALTAEISLGKEVITVAYPEKSAAFLEVVKPLGYRFEWEVRAHRMRVHPTMGSIEDRAAELMHKLLGGGFIVSCQRTEVREKALAASYEPIYPRWMCMKVRGRMAGWLHVLTRDGLDLSDDLRPLKARSDYYCDNSWFVRPQHYATLLDMAEVHDFRLTDGAWQALKKAQVADEAALLAQSLPDAPSATANTREPDQVAPAGIDPELRDD